MSAINSNWPIWIVKSIYKHFQDNMDLPAIFFEGQTRNVSTETRLSEVRLDGPWFTLLSKDYWRCYIEINILHQVNMSTDVNTQSRNMLQIHEDVGIIASNFWSGIGVYSYGDEGTLIGCLNLIADNKGKQRIQINHFGQVEQATNIIQASVEAHYEMFLES